jgi:hypothetical protein
LPVPARFFFTRADLPDEDFARRVAMASRLLCSVQNAVAVSHLGREETARLLAHASDGLCRRARPPWRLRLSLDQLDSIEVVK